MVKLNPSFDKERATCCAEIVRKWTQQIDQSGGARETRQSGPLYVDRDLMWELLGPMILSLYVHFDFFF